MDVHRYVPTLHPTTSFQHFYRPKNDNTIINSTRNSICDSKHPWLGLKISRVRLDVHDTSPQFKILSKQFARPRTGHKIGYFTCDTLSNTVRLWHGIKIASTFKDRIIEKTISMQSIVSLEVHQTLFALSNTISTFYQA